MSPLDPTSILLVEDNDDDLFFFRRVLLKAGITAPLAVATDGQKAIDHLNAPAHGATLPRIVFLDLKLPLKSGFEVLEWVRAQPSLSHVVVVILSSSAEARDIDQAFRLGAQGYLVKYPAPAVFRALLDELARTPATRDARQLTLASIPKP